jgi:predicted alpha/beta hydrolase family esterase
MTRAFLILHGWGGSGADHWQSWLAQRLQASGETVRYPSLPQADEPNLAKWLTALQAELDALASAREKIVVCHSLAVVLWLHYARTSRPCASVACYWLRHPVRRRAPRRSRPSFQSRAMRTSSRVPHARRSSFAATTIRTVPSARLFFTGGPSASKPCRCRLRLRTSTRPPVLARGPGSSAGAGARRA